MSKTDNQEAGPSFSKKVKYSKKYYEQQMEDSDSDFDHYMPNDEESEKNTAKLYLDEDIAWQTSSLSMKYFPFTKNEQLLVPPLGDNPMDYFRILLTDEFLQEVVHHTNIKATEVLLSEGVKEQSRITLWKELTVEELLIFLAIFLHMNNVKIDKLQDYWKTDPLFHVSGIAMNMSRNRFLIILRSLHFTTNPKDEPKPVDKLYEVRPVINYFNKRMSDVFYPGRELALDESMILWRGRLVFRQYIKNKTHKYGMKLYMLTNPNGFTLKLAVYTGMLDDFGNKAHAMEVVLNLLDGKINTGHHIYMDNYYNSYNMARKLLEVNTHCTGILKIDMNSPSDVMSAKLQKGESVARYANGVMIGKWKDKSAVCYISTEYKNEFVNTQNKRNVTKTKPKPLPIVNCNKFMFEQDQICSDYICERNTIQWPEKIFMLVVKMMVVNAHYLFNKYSSNKIGLYEFRIRIIKGLLPHTSAPQPTRTQLTNPHILTKREITAGKKQIMRKKCYLCSQRGKRTDTIYECKVCPGSLGYCLDCSNIIHK